MSLFGIRKEEILPDRKPMHNDISIVGEAGETLERN